MNRTSHASLTRSLVLIALVAVAFAPTSRAHVSDTAAIPDSARVDRGAAARTMLAGTCYYVNGRYVCY